MQVWLGLDGLAIQLLLLININFFSKIHLHFTYDVGGSRGLVVMGGDSSNLVCGFESQHQMQNRYLRTLICCQSSNVCLEGAKINEKETVDGSIFTFN